jgi:rubredoxin
MVYRWRCRHCEFTLWGADRGAVGDRVKSHLLEHHASHVHRDDIRTSWSCPYCEAQGEAYSSDDDAVDSFAVHLFEHAESLLESGAHIADEVGGTGSVLVSAPADGPAANNARAHFLARGDAVVLVTANPAARLRLVHSELDAWPAAVTVLTTVEDPLADVTAFDPAAVPIEFVTLNKRTDLSGVGETVARTVSKHEGMSGSLSVEFDILPEIVQKFELGTVFRFLHILDSRLDRADALSHFYVDRRRHQQATINVLEKTFDVSITAEGGVFTLEAAPDVRQVH